ncbi:SusD/RagB family nutrient-binding outer membrane lipoprotein [Fodinibius salsisoli]|uniref:SusD/RagB family nutrient-binding outer membrane lipoprotein n=1 Tax=Fodinibius salsisoli TaxID=2820877 RepID=A0ABT3PJR3_9BACT|nr:SusD/RagB family nutrient-binding outer membrane lipoprotein [Fodinibius salsisoli]MCW9706137.1 SusD/RagB family nutrient-binding outer membrane lipoprotein [Fodinibius salsisoli]
MKNSIYYLTVVLVAFTFTLSSCDTDALHDLNENPTVAEDIDPGFVLSYTQLQTSGERFENWRAQLIYQSTMIQQFATLPTYWAGDKYLYIDSYSGALWARAYTNYIKDLSNLVEITDPTVDGQDQWVNYHAIARIWKVVAFQRVTDLYGDVPYFGAGKGFSERNFFPSYDPQQEIYMDMLSELEESAAMLTSSASDPGSQDLIYGGDIEQWRRYAYSMMLRLGLRMTKVDPEAAEEWAQKAIAGGVMQSNADISYIQHTDGPEGINRNGIGEVFNYDGSSFTNDDSPRLSKTFVDWMNANDDPRLERLSWVVNGGPAQGLPNGYDATTIEQFDPGYDGDDYSRINPVFVLRESPMVFQTYAEVQFMLAEANERWGLNTGATAADHYEAGVRAAMEMYSIYDESVAVPSSEIDTYLAQNPYDSGNWDEILGSQYWAVTFLNFYETYANWRRTGYPELTPVDYPGNQTNGTIPRRLRYPGSESSGNPEAYTEALNRQGPDEFTTRMWWDAE